MKNRRLLVAAVPLALALLVGGCGSSGSKTASPAAADDGDKAAFCATNAELNEGTKGATSADEFITMLAPFQAKLDGFVASAPAVIKTDSQLLVDTAHKAISQGNGSLFADPQVVQAGKSVDTFCGVSSSS
jgi:hypothetical protein